MGITAGQLEEQGSCRAWNSMVDGNLDAVDHQIDPFGAATVCALDPAQRLESAHDRWGVVGGRDQLDVVDQVLTAAQRADRLRPVHARGRPELMQDGFGDRSRASEGNTRQ